MGRIAVFVEGGSAVFGAKPMDEVFDACEDGDAPWLLEILEDGGGVDDISTFL